MVEIECVYSVGSRNPDYSKDILLGDGETQEWRHL